MFIGGFEANILKPLEPDISVDQIVLLNVSKFMDAEAPSINFQRSVWGRFWKLSLGRWWWRNYRITERFHKKKERAQIEMPGSTQNSFWFEE